MSSDPFVKKGCNTDLSLSQRLRNEGRSSEAFEIMLSSLTLEELVALKIENSMRLTRGRMYGFKLWAKLPKIIKESVFNAVISISDTNVQAIRILGVSALTFNKYKANNSIKSKLSVNSEKYKER